MNTEYTPDPMARPRVFKSGPRDWKVLVPTGRDNVLGQLRLDTHSVHRSRRSAEKELERLLNE